MINSSFEKHFNNNHNIEYNDYCKSPSKECYKENIKASVIYSERTVQSINDFELPAPIGVSIDRNGKVNSAIFFELIEPLNLISDIKEKAIITQGLMHLKLIFKHSEPCPCSDLKKEICKEIYIPIQNVILNELVCDGLSSVIYTTNEIISFSVLGYPDIQHYEIGERIILIIKIILEIHYTFIKNKIITI